MNKSDIKLIVKTAVSLFLICAVSAGLLAFVNGITQPLITENSKKTADEAKSVLLPEATLFTDATDENGKTYSIATSGETTVGYVFTTSAAGYGGAIEVMTGINTDGVVTGITILTINETPGLGMNAQKDSFTSQYDGKTGPFNVIKNSQAGDNDIIALTSATISSKAVTAAVNEAVEMYAAIKEG